jgi:glyoxylase-like metal-dependent hydrolase (beta-lactamase superfamily II)
VAYLQPNGGLGEANVGLVIGEGESLVIDTCWDHVQARRMLGELAAWTERAPIGSVVNTHSNGDHWWGNSAMPDDAAIVATQAAAAGMRVESPRALVALQTGLRLACHLPLPASLDHKIRGGAHELAPFEFRSVRRRFPDMTFTGALDLMLPGGHRVELVEVQPAHTAGDLMAFDHGSGTVFAGDLLFIGQTPIMWAGPAANWIRALERLVAFDPEAIVPGHGPLPTLEDVRTHIAYWAWVSEVAADLHRRGVRVEQATLEMLRSSEFRAGPWAHWKRPEILAASLTAQYRHLDGKTGPMRQHHMAATMLRIQSVGDALVKGRAP